MIEADVATQILKSGWVTHALAGVGGFLLKLWHERYKAGLRVRERVVERQFDAHESLQEITQDLRTMTVDADPGIGRHPEVLADIETFAKWHSGVAAQFAKHEQWLDPQVRRDLYLIQDYLVCLGEVSRADEVEFEELRSNIAGDFIALSEELEASIRRFFASRIHRFDLSEEPEDHKRPQEETASFLAGTQLYHAYSGHFPDEYKNLIRTLE